MTAKRCAASCSCSTLGSRGNTSRRSWTSDRRRSKRSVSRRSSPAAALNTAPDWANTAGSSSNLRTPALVPATTHPPRDPRRHPRSIPPPGLRHHLLPTNDQPVTSLGVVRARLDKRLHPDIVDVPAQTSPRHPPVERPPKPAPPPASATPQACGDQASGRRCRAHSNRAGSPPTLPAVSRGSKARRGQTETIASNHNHEMQ